MFFGGIAFMVVPPHWLLLDSSLLYILQLTKSVKKEKKATFSELVM
jgi:hypothetical protein